MDHQNQTNIVRLVVVGIGGVGKSALTLFFMYDEFVQDYEPTRVDSYRKRIICNGEEVNLHILDTAGQEEYAGMRDSFYRNSEGFCLVFDVTDRQSFDSIPDFIEHILRVKQSEKVPILICGNKIDLAANRKVTVEEIENLCNRYHVPYFETSAKTNINVEKAFLTLAQHVYSLKVSPRDQHQGAQPDKTGRRKRRCRIL